MGRYKAIVMCSLLGILLSSICMPLSATAQGDPGFSLQVSPSPLVATVKPGVETTLDLQVRNTNTTTQALKMGLRPFSIDEKTGQVQLGTSVSSEVQQLVTFETPIFSLNPGEIKSQKIRIRPPISAGFNYNFAITISQQNKPKPQQGTSAIEGTVAVFTLLDVDKPGAKRSLELTQISTTKRVYEYLPTKVNITVKNKGNVNVLPAGSVFIQRSSSTTAMPLASLKVNADGGYVIPGATRTFTAQWNDGFPRTVTTQEGGKEKSSLSWQGDMSKFRFGKYVAKVVAVYDDGERDVPIMAEVSFWVIPWKFLLLVLALLLILIIGMYVTVRSGVRRVQKPGLLKNNRSNGDTQE